LSNQDMRTHACNDRVAAIELASVVNDVELVQGEIFQSGVPAANLYSHPNMENACQLLFGQDFRVLETRDGWCFGQILADGYVGYIQQLDLVKFEPPTHWVTNLGSGLYKQGDLKAPLISWLPMGSMVAVDSVDIDFACLRNGLFVPRAHLSRINAYDRSFIRVAQKFIGCPYLWGGQTLLGIDCSGLVQVALHACGIQCPRDSDQQVEELGTFLSPKARPDRGYLAYWKGHIGIMLDETNLLHANAHTMSVIIEPLSEVTDRIKKANGDILIGYKDLS